MAANEPKTKGKNKGGRPPVHGAFSLLTRASIDELPKRRRYLRPYLTDCREGWIHDLGGEERLTTSQRVLVDRAVTFLGAIRLVEEHMKEKGLFPGGLLNAGLTQHYLAWNRALTECMKLLGIDRRPAEAPMSPLEIAAEIDAERVEAGNQARGTEKASPSAAQSEIQGQEGQDNER